MKNRNGSYKKILIDESTLGIHRDYLQRNVEAIKNLNLSPIDFTTLYLLLFLRIKHPKNWLQKNNQNNLEVITNKTSPKLLEIIPESFELTNWEIEKLQDLTASELFANFNLKAIPLSINKTMINWHLGLWAIVVFEYIPSPRELLKLQVKNNRCITLITDLEKIDSLVFGSRDPLSFVLHDLMHADQFFSQTNSLKGQLGFYQRIDSIYNKEELKFYLKSNNSFKGEFEYVSSDMNAYVIHLFKCLKSSICRADPSEDFFTKVLTWWDMSQEEKDSSYKLNTPAFTIDHEIILKNYFEKHQEHIS